MKLLTILRGLPGAGKSTRAKKLRDEGAVTISNDDYFTSIATGEYNFDRSRLDEAIKSCRFNVLLAMKKDIPHIVVDNCFIYRSGMRPYIDAAQRHGYKVIVEIIGGFSDEDVRDYARRNIHGTPLPAIAAMAEKFEV